ncbi:MAG: hypothetical protein Q7T80_06090 [Methanoregula sp.]|nr:hypothetical protein [Methanoregula sp.]
MNGLHRSSLLLNSARSGVTKNGRVRASDNSLYCNVDRAAKLPGLHEYQGSGRQKTRITGTHFCPRHIPVINEPVTSKTDKNEMKITALLKPCWDKPLIHRIRNGEQNSAVIRDIVVKDQ